MEILALMATVMMSCSSSDENDPNNLGSGKSPENPRSEFRFYKEGVTDKYSFAFTPTNDPTAPLFTLNSSTLTVESPAFYYTKTGENTADVSCWFIVKAWNGYGSWQQYELKLTFLSPIHGTIKGKFLNNPESSGTDWNGMFTYNTDKVLSELVGSESNNEENNKNNGNNGGNNKQPDQKDPTINISRVEISEIEGESVRAQGTMVTENDTAFSEWKLLVSTEPIKEVISSYKKEGKQFKSVNVNKFYNVVVTNLYQNTNYYTCAAAYLKSKEKWIMGEQTIFTTKKIHDNKFQIKPHTIGRNYIEVEVVAPNEIDSYGLCWDTKENPKVTNHFLETTRSSTYKKLVEGIEAKNTYYIRAYWVKDNEIVYDTNQFTISSLDPNMLYVSKTSHRDAKDYKMEVIATITYNNLPAGLNKITVSIPAYKKGDLSDKVTTYFYAEGSGEHTVYLTPYKANWWANVEELKLFNQETGITYDNEYPNNK